MDAFKNTTLKYFSIWNYSRSDSDGQMQQLEPLEKVSGLIYRTNSSLNFCQMVILKFKSYSFVICVRKWADVDVVRPLRPGEVFNFLFSVVECLKSINIRFTSSHFSWFKLLMKPYISQLLVKIIFKISTKNCNFCLLQIELFKSKSLFEVNSSLGLLLKR